MGFKLGDTVQLKSGGPVMTLSYKNESGSWNATWFLNGEVKWATFHPETLKHVNMHDD